MTEVNPPLREDLGGHRVLSDTPGGILLLWHTSGFYSCARCEFNADPQTPDAVLMAAHLGDHIQAMQEGKPGHIGAAIALDALDRDVAAREQREMDQDLAGEGEEPSPA